MEGYHVVRRSDRYWARLSTDLIIEQVLTRNNKTTGGMTRGRGMMDLQRAAWLLSTPASADVNCAMQELTGVTYEPSEQHKETTQAPLVKDFDDSITILKYGRERNPFSNNQQELFNIHTR